MPNYASDIAFTPTIKAIQSRKGSRPNYARMEERGSWQTAITDDLAVFIAAQTSVFLATVNADGQPYIQHRGGPPGFLHVLDAQTIGFADFGFLHFQPKVITFTSSFTDPSKNRITTMLAGNSGDKFGEDNGFTKTRTAEQACFATTTQRVQEVNNLNTRLKDLDLGR